VNQKPRSPNFFLVRGLEIEIMVKEIKVFDDMCAWEIAAV